MKIKVGDVYGQVHPHETPELVEKKMEEFNQIVSNTTDSDKQNLMTAECKCPELLTDSFKLMFLRCEVFNVELAAMRYIKYWDKRVEIFGTEKAFEALTLAKALRDDTVALSTGFFRLTGTKGKGGRNIVFCDPSLQDNADYTRESMVRTIWYMLHAALEDEDTQKNGFVFIVYPWKSTTRHFDRELCNRVFACVKGCLPIRLSAMHFCHPTKIMLALFPIVKVIMGDRLRKRIIVHSASQSKARAELEKYDLYEDKLPVEIGGKLTLDHDRWLKERNLHGK